MFTISTQSVFLRGFLACENWTFWVKVQIPVQSSQIRSTKYVKVDNESMFIDSVCSPISFISSSFRAKFEQMSKLKSGILQYCLYLYKLKSGIIYHVKLVSLNVLFNFACVSQAWRETFRYRRPADSSTASVTFTYWKSFKPFFSKNSASDVIETPIFFS